MLIKNNNLNLKLYTLAQEISLNKDNQTIFKKLASSVLIQHDGTDSVNKGQTSE